MRNKCQPDHPIITDAAAEKLSLLGQQIRAYRKALRISVTRPPERGRPKGWIPARVRIADYPQLKGLAWQAHDTNELSPREALGIHERSWLHLDLQAMEPAEGDLIDALRLALGTGAHV